MKKISSLLLTMLMACSLSAQIDSFSDSDNFVIAREKPAFNKFAYLSPYESALYDDERNKWNPILQQWYTIYNIVGEQVYYRGSDSAWVIARKNNELVLSKIQPNSYYTVRDILITQEEVDSLRSELANLVFKSDTLYYEESSFRKKVKKSTTIPQSHVLRKLCHTRFQPEDWFRQEDKGEEFLTRIYVLNDENNVEYFIPSSVGEYDVLYYEAFSDGYDRRGISLNGMESFIVVKGFLSLKQKFENQLIYKYYGEEKNHETFICKKIALKDGQLFAAITDTLSTEVSYISVDEFKKEKLSDDLSKDTLLFITETGVEKYDAYCTVHDLDSVKKKNEYAKHLAEIERAKKDAKRKQELINKYGQKYGTSILNKKACVGMTKVMCKEAIGSPDNMTQRQTAGGTIEVWTYTLAYRMWNGLAPVTVVTFTNGKVTAVDEYTSWP